MIAELIILLVVTGLIYAVGTYVLPEPAKKVAVVVSALIAIIALVNFLMVALGHAPLVPLHIS